MTLTPEELERQIRDVRNRQKAQSSSGAGNVMGPDKGAARMAFRAGVELVSALVVGGLLGYWIDQWLGSKPWAMIVMLFLGFIAGFVNIYRAQTGQDMKIGFRKEDDGKNKEG